MQIGEAKALVERLRFLANFIGRMRNNLVQRPVDARGYDKKEDTGGGRNRQDQRESDFSRHRQKPLHAKTARDHSRPRAVPDQAATSAALWLFRRKAVGADLVAVRVAKIGRIGCRREAARARLAFAGAAGL